MAFYRNIRARDQLEIFLVSAVSSVLLVRFYLSLTGFPQISAGNFHIAHVLWGGLLMLAAVVIAVSFMGIRAQRISALVGGLGFGVFIDEIGKFITKDNDYFYRPAIGIIYAIFLIMYLAFNFISRDAKLSSREYQINALAQLEEAIAHDLDVTEKAHAQALLKKADQKSQITKDLQRMLNDIQAIPDNPLGRLGRTLKKTDALYRKFWRQRESNRLVRIFFVAQASIFFVAVLASMLTNLDDLASLLSGQIDYGKSLLVGEFAASFVAALFAVKGAFVLKISRMQAFEYFRQATLINLFLTDFFTFTRIEFAALPGFISNLLLLVVINYVIHQERKLDHLRNVQRPGLDSPVSGVK